MTNNIKNYILGFCSNVDPFLETAIINNDVESVRSLLKQGANANAIDERYGEKMIHLAAKANSLQETAFILSRTGKIEEVQQKKIAIIDLLIEYGANANDLNSKMQSISNPSPICRAAYDGYVLIVKHFLEKGYYVNNSENNEYLFHFSTISSLRLDLVAEISKYGIFYDIPFTDFAGSFLFTGYESKVEVRELAKTFATNYLEHFKQIHEQSQADAAQKVLDTIRAQEEKECFATTTAAKAKLAIEEGDLAQASLLYKSIFANTNFIEYDQLSRRMDSHLEIGNQTNLTIPGILTRTTYIPTGIKLNMGEVYQELYQNVQVQPYMAFRALESLTNWSQSIQLYTDANFLFGNPKGGTYDVSGLIAINSVGCSDISECKGIVIHEMAHHAFDVLYKATFVPYYISDNNNEQPKRAEYRQVHLDFLKNAASFLGANYDPSTSITDLKKIRDSGMMVFKDDSASYVVESYILLYNKYLPESLDAELIVREPQARAAGHYEESATLLQPITDYICKYTMPALLDYIAHHPMRDRIIFDPHQDFGCGIIGATESEMEVVY